MRALTYLVLASTALAVTACSHAERSATTPAPQASYVASTNIESEASEQAAQFCEFYHSKPAQLADRAGTISRFECTGRARGGDSFFVERMGL
jgi:hypothetical protein